MNRIARFMTLPRIAALTGLMLVLAAIALVGFAFDLPTSWQWIAGALVATLWGAWQLHQYLRARDAARNMANMLSGHAANAVRTAPADRKQDIELLRIRMLDAIRTIRTSRLGQAGGEASLYELPWYIVIGNPAAGKSTAILNSGLNFPFSDKGGQPGGAIQGIGGTRNCDWFFTTDGILLDTAGRYAVQEDDRNEWFGFLRLLKKYRPRAPINGVIIVASIAELTSAGPEASIALARDLRQRVQELTERLELFAPVYLMFTKVDLIAGFADFFEDADVAERSRVWGATLPYDADGKANAAALFERHFDTLADGLRELGTTRMALDRCDNMSPGVLTFPLEFAGIKHHLRTFIATLFDENPYQFKPIFRGFYFTSAIQEGAGAHAAAERIIRQFDLARGRKLSASVISNTGFFLRNLFASVIFADRNLVRQYASRSRLRLRYAAFYVAVMALGLALGGWSWSFATNRQYVANVQADLEQVLKVQENRHDLASRLEALGILQDRLQQLRQYREERPLQLGFGLYQGKRLEHRLRAEYFKGLQQVMLEPVAIQLESYLAEVNTHAGNMLQPEHQAPGGITLTSAVVDNKRPQADTLYREAMPNNVDDAYGALKTYLMLGDRRRVEPDHLNDQMARHWRIWLEYNRGNAPREQVIRHAEKLIAFYIAQADQPDFPLIENKLALVDQVRQTLRPVIRGTPARERAYGEIRMRAATRFPIVTVASIVGDRNRHILSGSHTVSGAFTRKAWEQYVRAAIRDAATTTVQSSDWVLKTSARDDLSLEGSPEQIERELIRLYKADYVREWQQFMQGIAIREFESFENAVQYMNVLGDPQSSPIDQLLQTLHRETSWDSRLQAAAGTQADDGIGTWFRENVLRRPAPPAMLGNAGPDAVTNMRQDGAISAEFPMIASLVVPRGEKRDMSLMKGYLQHLSRVRARFNQIANAGDFGPASRQLMQATLEGDASELADALRYIDESMLTGMPPAARATIRPLLVRPLMQAFAVIILPAERELNRTWMAQVHEPFAKSLSAKYPFSSASSVEATPAEIAQFFGPDGAIAKFVQNAMGPLVIRRGDTLAARTWADMGVRLNPHFSANLARYVSPQGSGATAGNQVQTSFQLLPLPSPGLVEYTVDIDGQSMRYRNGRQDWHNFVWPHAQGQPGARISVVTSDGRALDVANFPGQFGLEKLVNSATRQKQSDGSFRMRWEGAGQQVELHFRLISDARPGTDVSGAGLTDLKLPARVAGDDVGAEAAAPSRERS